jgi:hypothetical protein
LPMYLSDAKPWACAQHPFAAALDHLAADQRQYAERVAKAILELAGRPDPGRFPSEFAAKNDLSLDFVLGEVVEAQSQDVAKLERCARQFVDMPSLHALAEEIYGNACGHLEILRDAIRAQS